MVATLPDSFVGRSLLRVEDDALVRGAGAYLDDLDVPGILHLALSRSPLAHARLTGLDTDEARHAPGVCLVLTGADVAGHNVPPRPNPKRRIPARPMLASEVVRMVGDPVAAVIAETPALARDAADLVFADFDPLPVVGDPDEAIDAPPLYPEYGDNIVYDRSSGDPADIDAIDGAIIVTGTVEHPRVVPAPIETRSILAMWEEGGLTVHLGTQAPVYMAEELAWAFDLPKTQVRVVVPSIGGAFGCKFDLAEEELVVVEAARRLARPVKWVESRREHFLTIGHGRAQRHRYKAVADADGTLLGLWVESLVDVGARQRYLAFAPYTPRIGTGTYVIPAYAYRQRGVFTNRAPRGIYRGAGRPEATLTIERIIDRVARKGGLDPADVRRRNFVTEFPYTSPGGATYDSGDYVAALDKLLEVADYEGLRARQAVLRDEGRYLGIGLCAYVEATGFETSEDAVVEVEPDGAVRAQVGTLDHCQGHRITFAQVVADELGIHPSQVAVEQGDTAAIPFGHGTSGSRSAAHGSGSAGGAARVVAEKAARIAAHLLEADPGDVVLAGGRAEVRGVPGSGVTWGEVAAAAHDSDLLPPGEDVGLRAEFHFEPGGLNFPFGMHLAVVEIDPDTGVVQLDQVWAVDDCGTVINPMLATGQRHGGLAQGIGQALFERAVYDEDGNLQTATFLDYLIPSAGQVPTYRLDSTVTPSPHNPLGAKGVAEAGAVGIPPAIVNAAVDALASFGVEHLDLPLLPETVWSACRGASRQS